jgi:hypothetical protein
MFPFSKKPVIERSKQTPSFPTVIFFIGAFFCNENRHILSHRNTYIIDNQIAPTISIEQIMSEERKVALITGITGQDGSYLTELLLSKGYTVSR